MQLSRLVEFPAMGLDAKGYFILLLYAVNLALAFKNERMHTRRAGFFGADYFVNFDQAPHTIFFNFKLNGGRHSLFVKNGN